MVIIDHDGLGGRARLAGEYKPSFQFPRLQRVVHFHLRAAFDQLGAAGRTHPAFAGERQVQAGARRGIENGFSFRDWHIAALTIDDQGRNCLGRRTRGYCRLRTRLAAEARNKTLDVNAIGVNAQVPSGRLDVLAIGCGTADEDVIDGCGRYERAQQHPHLLAIEPAVQDRNVLFFA